MLTFDRYLLRNFFHVFGVCFITMFGLVVVIDLLENLDDFIEKNGDGSSLNLLENVVRYYGYQSIFFIDRAGPSLTLIAVIVVLLLFQRSGELHPLLAAGIPMFRVLSPLVFAGALVSGLLVLNQEFVIPKIAFAAHAPRGSFDSTHVSVEPVYDYASRISIDGRRLLPAQRTIEQAEFVLPAPTIASELTILRAEKAIHRSARKGQPAGWILQEVTPSFEELSLTESGARLVRPLAQDHAIFVTTAVTCDQLYKRGSSYTLLSSKELLRRIHSPAFGAMSVHRLVAYLHTRSVQPFLNVLAVLLVIPLIVRRESPGLVVDSAICTAVLALNFVIIQSCFYLGQARIVPPDLAAWLPVIFSGSLAAWISGWIRT